MSLLLVLLFFMPLFFFFSTIRTHDVFAQVNMVAAPTAILHLLGAGRTVEKVGGNGSFTLRTVFFSGSLLSQELVFHFFIVFFQKGFGRSDDEVQDQSENRKYDV
jgi:hypothetical protein